MAVIVTIVPKDLGEVTPAETTELRVVPPPVETPRPRQRIVRVR